MKSSLSLSTALLVMLVPVAGSVETPVEISVGEDEARAEQGDLPPQQIALQPALDFRRWPDDGFFETKISLLDAMSSAHSDERGAVMLDLAELYLSQMLTYEAKSFVEAAAETGWASSPRYHALRDAVNLLQGEAINDPDASPLLEANRPDRGLWLSLNGIAIGDAEKLSGNLPEGLLGLSFQSGPVARALLPLIAEAAVSLRNLSVSETALALIDTVPEIADSPVGQYLHGRHASNTGNNKSALEAYFDASQGWDRYAARARIAIADLAIDEGSLGALLAARDVLSAGVGAWRGDVFEIASLERKATVSGLLDEPAAALIAYRRILIRFPESAEAEAAISAAGQHLEALYTQGAEGQIELADWFELHQILLPTYRYFPEFPPFNELLADSVFGMGGTYLAIAEYRQTLSIYEDWPSALGQVPRSEDLDRLHYKLARALVRAQYWEDALDALDKVSPEAPPGFRDAVNTLRLRSLKELGESDALLRTFVSAPDADSLRSWGQALFARQDWEGAKAQYTRLLEVHPDQFRIGDASYLLIAAHRTEDKALGRRVARAFPELTESEGLAGLALSLLDEATPLMPLRDDMTSDRLESARDIMSLIESSGL